MCPRDDAHLTMVFPDHFVIKPTIKYYDKESDYSTNELGEQGVRVEPGFEYNSGTNPQFLNIEELKSLNQQY